MARPSDSETASAKKPLRIIQYVPSSASVRPSRRPPQAPPIPQAPSIPQAPRAPRIDLRRCLACGKLSCNLQSHKQYSKKVIASRFAAVTGGTMTVASPLSSQVTNPRVNAFGRFAFGLTLKEHCILDTWTEPWGADTNNRSIERHLFPKVRIEAFLPLFADSPLVLRAALALVATQKSLSIGKIDAFAYDQQQNLSRLHIEAIANPEEASSDANILAGLTILSNHMAQGNVQKAKGYLDGINRMVAIRGGPHNLGLKGAVAAYLLQADHIESICSCTKPTWSMPLPSLQFPEHSPLLLGRGFQRLVSQLDLDLKLSAAATDLCRATQVFDLGCHEKASRQELESFEYLSTVAEFQLGTLHAAYHCISPRNSCICLALLIFNLVVLRDSGVMNPAIRLLETRFWHIFRKADAEGCWDFEDDCFLAWIVVTPLVTSFRAHCPYTGYAITKLATLKSKAKIQGWEDFEARVLRPFLWLEMIQKRSLQHVWKEVEVICDTSF